jgi:hypothetical protein
MAAQDRKSTKKRPWVGYTGIVGGGYRAVTLTGIAVSEV